MKIEKSQNKEQIYYEIDIGVDRPELFFFYLLCLGFMYVFNMYFTVYLITVVLTYLYLIIYTRGITEPEKLEWLMGLSENAESEEELDEILSDINPRDFNTALIIISITWPGMLLSWFEGLFYVFKDLTVILYKKVFGKSTP